MIAWKYIDKAAATVAAMRDYDSMRVIINNTPEEIKALYERMTTPRAPALSGLPSARNPKSGEDKIIEQLDKLDLLRDRYSNAVEYMSWFAPAWNVLSESEQHILERYYMDESLRNGGRGRLAGELNYTERHIDRLRGKALQRLQVLLFG